VELHIVDRASDSTIRPDGFKKKHLQAPNRRPQWVIQPKGPTGEAAPLRRPLWERRVGSLHAATRLLIVRWFAWTRPQKATPCRDARPIPDWKTGTPTVAITSKERKRHRKPLQMFATARSCGPCLKVHRSPPPR